MEALEKVGDAVGQVFGGVERSIRGLFGSSNDRDVKKLGFARNEKTGDTKIVSGSMLDYVAQQEPIVQALSEGELLSTADVMRARLKDGETLDDIMPDMFARIREAGVRFLKMRHYDVQLVGGAILHSGRIAEMVTGEGKTLVATLPAALNAVGGHVHCVTVNDYLARRDMEWMAPLYMGLGLTVNCIQGEMGPQERQRSYSSDICYGTNNEFGFDYLRDNMKPHKSLQVQGPLDFALVDEIDNILIDEARTPLIISGKASDDLTKYPKADKIARQLTRDKDFEVKEKEKTCHLTDEGIRRAESLAGVESFYTAGNMEWPHLIDNALRAHYMFQHDKDYVVEPTQDPSGRVEMDVVIIDEHTGRKMSGRQWSDGLHQAVQAKEGIRIREQNQTFATITLQNYFKLYRKLAGMTGTAMTEADEFLKIYGLDVVAVPTNRPMQRINHADMIYRTEKEKWRAVVEEVKQEHGTGRPVLIGTTTIEKSEKISAMLKKQGIKHELLNAKQHEREAEIVAQAGRVGAVTIATNMAGRGTDIILGGNPEHLAWEELKDQYNDNRLEVPKDVWETKSDEIAERLGMKVEGKQVSELGGLHVVGTERHDARRIDLQLRGRAGRQGDPGSSRFFLSLDDDLMRIFAGDFVRAVLDRLGMQEGEAIESPMVSRRIEKAQKKVEERHFDGRKNLLEYDEVMDHQRKEVYSFRQKILDGANCREMILDMIDKQVGHWTNHFLDPDYRWETIVGWANSQIGVLIEPHEIRGMDREQLDEFLRDESKIQAEEMVRDQLDENLPDEEDESEWNWQALSRWANSRYGLNTSERELKKVGREDLQSYLAERAKEAVDRANFQDLYVLMDEEFPQKQLCGFLQHQYGLNIKPGDLPKIDEIEDVIDYVNEQVRQAYRKQEVLFPVLIGLTNFMPERAQGTRRDPAGLAKWAANRFRNNTPETHFDDKARRQIEAELVEFSEAYFPGDEPLQHVDDLVQRAYRESEMPTDENALQELLQLANEDFDGELEDDSFATLDRTNARQLALAAFDGKYRPELGQAERSILLDVLDHAWKEHLLYMDHLRANIGLVGYAQKDPKTEYKREGMKAFEGMWDRVGEQVTGAVFRLEQPSPDFAAATTGVFAEATASHAESKRIEADQAAEDYNESSGGVEAGSEATAVETIVRSDQKVGRNDPCPCGSGKKYKKCCGA